MRVLVSGDRHWPWSRHDVIKEALSWFDPKTTILIHGDADGADRIAGTVAEKLLGWPKNHIYAVPAEWTKFGHAAGNIRNGKMLEKGKPDIVLAFHPNLWGDGEGERSKGTKHMVMIACAADVPVLHYV